MGNVKIFAKGANVQLTKNFNSNEFDCKCKRATCKQTLIDMDHVANMQKFRERVGKPISQTCAYRCPEHNKEVGGVSNSQHPQGFASDIVVPGLTPNQVADLAEPIFNNFPCRVRFPIAEFFGCRLQCFRYFAHLFWC